MNARRNIATLGMVAFLAACASPSAVQLPAESPSAQPTVSRSQPVKPSIKPRVKVPQVSADIEAAKKILAAYTDPGDLATITPERFLYMVKQECASRKLTGHGLGVDRWQREGLLKGGEVPPIPCVQLGEGNLFNDIPKS